MRDLLLHATYLLPVLLTVLYVVVDLIIDHELYGRGFFSWSHAIVAGAVLLATAAVVAHGAQARRRSEMQALATQEELVARIRERTAELELANAHLQAEIRERERTEDALRTSETKYRMLFQNMAEGFALYELLYDGEGRAVDWKVVEVNASYAQHTGLRPEEVLGRRGSEKFPHAVSSYLPHFERVVSTQAAHSIETYAEAVGRFQRVSTFPAGGPFFANIIEDISQRKQEEDDLCASEEKFAKVFHFAPDAICLIERETLVVLDANEAFGRLFGYKSSDVIGAEWRKLGITSLGEADRLGALLDREDEVLDHEMELTSPSGSVAFVLVSVIPVTVRNELRTLLIAHDITARKRSQEALRKAEAELALGLQARAALEERQHLARELHDSVSQALYGVSLAVNTALALYDDDRAKSLEALHYALEQSRAALTEMRALIFELRPESLESEGLVAAISKQADALRARSGVEIRLALPEEPEIPLRMKEALYRIVQEALNNVIKHAHATKVDIQLQCDGLRIVVDVRDDGVGFDARAEHPGHLGLKSMRERAQALDGTLEIASAPGQGASIRASIPITQGPVKPD
jgi:PAS domain S-box-containing protein